MNHFNFRTILFVLIAATFLILFLSYLKKSKQEKLEPMLGPYNKLILADDKGNMNGIDFPKGMIMIWYGTDTEIPKGWVLCDGQNGTPDLRGRFVMGMNPNANRIDGSPVREYKKLDGAETSNVTLTVDNIPPHIHDYKTGTLNDDVYQSTGGCSCRTNTVTSDNRNSQQTTGASGSATPVNVPVMPPFMAMAYIMKIV